MKSKHTLPSTPATLASLAVAFVATALVACDAAPPEPTEPAPGIERAADPAPGALLTERDVVTLMLEPDPFVKARKLGTLLPTLGPESVPAVREALQRAAVLEMGVSDYELFIAFWAVHEPEQAAMFSFQDAPRMYQVSAVHAAMREWTAQDPKAALSQAAAWAMVGGDAGVAVEIALVRGWYASGEPGLVEYIHDLGMTFDRQRALRIYTQQRVRQEGAEALIQWVEGLPESDPRFRLEAFRAAGPSIVSHDTAAAVRFCDAHCEQGYAPDLREWIADRWVRSDPRAAFAWLETAPPGPETASAIGPPYAAWTRRDPAAAMAWMKEKTAEKIPLWLLPTYFHYSSMVVVEEGPLAALEWVTRIEDEEQRNANAVRIARTWRESDAAAADAWLDQSFLPPDLVERARGPAPPLRGPESELP